jgi:hypothetical protein
MKNMPPAPAILLGAALGVSSALLAMAAQAADRPDYAREARLAEQTVDAIFDGDVEMLTAKGHKFLSVFMRASAPEVHGTVVLMHGRGMHPDWEDVIGPLRVELTQHGWNTLSIQMPVLPKDAKYYDYVPLFPAAAARIEVAISTARARGAQKVVLLAHSCSVHMSMAYVRKHGDARIDGYVGIGMGATDYKQPMREPFPFAEMHVPVLDLFGSEDFAAVKRLAPARKRLIMQANPLSSQVEINAAEHYFKGRSESLLAVIAQWLGTVTVNNLGTKQ